MRRRVALTGIGVVAPGGGDRKEFWDLLTAGRTATRTVSLFDASAFRSCVAGECDFDPIARGFTEPDARYLDRATQLALTATDEATKDSDLAPSSCPPPRLAVAIGSAVGCTMSLERSYVEVSDRGKRWLVGQQVAGGRLYDYFVPSSIAGTVARRVGAEGAVSTVSTGCTSGIDSVGYACELIRDDIADVVVTGATDAPLSPITFACFDAIKATTPQRDQPHAAAKPFDRRRDGFVLAEGAAVLMLEEMDRARRRGAHIYAEIAGYATRCNAYHMTGLRADGREMAAAITAALTEARLNAEDIDYISAHGSGTKQNDRHETAAVKQALGRHAYATPMSSIKSMIGHSLGAIGSLEIAACALAIESGVVPPTANLYEPDPECDLDYVPVEARERPTDVVLTVGSGFGGFQSAMVLGRPAAVSR